MANGRAAITSHRFPPPWSVEETDACFIVRDANGQALAYMYFLGCPKLSTNVSQSEIARSHFVVNVQRHVIHDANQFNNVVWGGQKAMGIAGGVRVEPDDVALVIDSVEQCKAGGVRIVQRDECAHLGIVDDAVRDAVDNVKANRDAVIVQSKELRLGRARRVHGREDAMVVHETVNDAPGIGVEPGDVALVVDRRRNRADPRRVIDVG